MLTYNWDRQRAGVRAINARRVEHAPGHGWQWHRHDYIECFCVDSGSLHHSWDDTEHELVPGDFALVPGEAHRAVAGSQGATIINLSCATETLAWLRTRAGGLTTPWDGERAQRHRVVSHSKRDLLRAVVANVDPTTAAGRDVIVLTLVQILHTPGIESDPLPVWIQRAIAAHLEASDRGGVAALAERCGCSREHLSRCIRQLTGMTAVAWLRFRRTQHAAQLLRSTDLGVLAVGEVAGFASPSAFHAAFRDHYHMSPRRWRSQQHTDGSV